MDKAKEKFDQLYSDWVQNAETVETEQDVRFKIIDRMLTDVLGWNYKEISTERHTDSGYIDYLIHSEGRNRLVVEAKKQSTLLIDTKNPRLAGYKINGPALVSAKEGIQQAKRYCIEVGVSFAILTSGFEWIGFIAVRTDGKPPDEGKAIAFPNLTTIRDNFASFYDLFSKQGVINQLYKIKIYEIEGLQIQHSENLFQAIDDNQIRLLNKSKFSHDLDQIFRGFFSTMSGEDDPEMLAKCFVESKESQEADSNLEKITKNLINEIDVVSTDRGTELQEHIRAAVETKRGEFVLIIGNKGSGKSTFVDRFFRLILDLELRHKCLVIRIDLADSSGDILNINNWLINKLKETIEETLFKDKTPTFEELQGIFFRDYKRWQNGEHKFLYQKDKVEFKIKFGEYIAKMIAENPSKYIEYLLQDAVRSRRLMPCIIFDNADHFPQLFQEQIFQFAQSLHRQVFSFVICPITDRTIWQLSKSGPLQSYITRSFYLPVPSTKEILKRRVSFIKEKIDEEKSVKGEYFLSKGIRLNINDIQAFAACIEDILINTDYVARMVGWISNHDIRRSLRISQRIVTSPLISIDQLVTTYFAGDALSVPRYQIKKALIYGDYNYFCQEHSEFILNLFLIKSDQITSPLLKLSILRLLSDRENEYKDTEDAYISIDDIQNYFESTGISRSIIRAHLKDLLDYRLVEPYDPTDQNVYEEQRVKITYSGKIHLEFCLTEDVYVSHMALVTPNRSYELVSKIREIMQSKLSRSDWLKIISQFLKYCIEQDRLFISLPKLEIYDSQSQLRNELKMKWTDSLTTED